MRNLASSYGKGASVVALLGIVSHYSATFLLFATLLPHRDILVVLLDPHPSLLFILNQKVITNALAR